jgi:flavin-binding protein dodecin
VAVIKSIELIGVSTQSWDDAARKALAEAAKTLRGIEHLEVLDQTAVVREGEIAEFQRPAGSASASTTADPEPGLAASSPLTPARLRASSGPAGQLACDPTH